MRCELKKKPPPELRQIGKEMFEPKQSLGQHFLFDQNLAMRIVKLAGDLKNTNIIEIGSGPGTLTRAILNAGAKTVFAIECDQRFNANLAELQETYPDKLVIINSDALLIDFKMICKKPRKIIANLPYNIATPLLIKWLKNVSSFDKFVLMFQKEVAQRLAAKPKTKAYGRLSIMSQWLCEVKTEFNISNNLFYPPPKVISTVVSLTPRAKRSENVSWESLEAITATTFGQRRKMLRSTLKSLNLDPKKYGIEPTCRPEELSIDDFCRLAKALIL